MTRRRYSDETVSYEQEADDPTATDTDAEPQQKRKKFLQKSQQYSTPSCAMTDDMDDTVAEANRYIEFQVRCSDESNYNAVLEF